MISTLSFCPDANEKKGEDSFFGVNSKDCYRFYTDIKRRKNDSRTYFLDKMQVKLNEKMRRGDELERMRR